MLRNETDVFTKLQRIETVAREDVTLKFTSLAHLLTPEFLMHFFEHMNQKGAPGVDGVTIDDFAKTAKENIETLHQELKEQRYRADNVRRVYIPKTDGKLRPLGIPSVKDRIVQRAVAEIIGRIYEPYFLNISYGFRSNRSAHDALKAVQESVSKNPVKWIVDVDIKGYFDSVNHGWMKKFLEHRIADKTILRLVSKFLNAGILENGVVVRNEEGTPQGGPISPLLANIYLHYVLDLWFEKKYKQGVEGYSFLVRYADDFVVGFERREEAEKFLKELRKRLAEFSLEISEEKTRIVRFGTDSDEGNGTFAFLGFVHYIKSKGKRSPVVARKPNPKSRNKFLKNVKEWLRGAMHASVPWQKKMLSAKLKGYYNYFGLRYCQTSLMHVKRHVERMWIMTLRRRSQKHKLWWNRIYGNPLYRLPEPRLV